MVMGIIMYVTSLVLQDKFACKCFQNCSNERKRKPRLVKYFAKVKAKNQYIRSSAICST